MTKNYGTRPERLAIIAMIFSILLFAGGLSEAYFSKALIFKPVWISGIVAFLASLISWGRCYFLRRAAEEEAELKEYLHKEGRNDLFDDTDEAVRLAKRASEHYTKYVVSVFTVALGIGLTLIAWILIQRHQGLLESNSLPTPQGALSLISLAVLGVVAALGAGGYYTGASREPGQRWLRPIGAWFLYSSFAYFIAAVTLGLQESLNWSTGDVRGCQFLLYTLLILGIEQLVGVVIEFYRPRSPGEEERPLYESRLLALFTEPGGVAKNLAQSLDYQFGFQVSEGWFYRNLERTLVPSLIFLGITLWLLTCIVQINPNEQGLRYSFGKIAEEPLIPRHCPYFKLPHPFGRIEKYPVGSIQHLTVGDDGKKPDGPEINEALVLWSKIHERKEMPFLVANRLQDQNGKEDKPNKILKDGETEDESKVPVSAYYLSANIPISFRVKDIFLYKCKHSDPKRLLEGIASQEVSRYLARTDFNEIIPSENVADAIAAKNGTERVVHTTLAESKLHQMADEVLANIQVAADKAELGVEVIFIGLQEMHPPVETGESFDAMVGARVEKETLVQQARSDAIQIYYLAESASTVINNRAEAHKTSAKKIAEADVERFAGQLACYKEAPQVYILNQYLEILDNSLRPVRKYIMAAEPGRETLIFDLKEKATTDLSGLNIDDINYGGGK